LESEDVSRIVEREAEIIAELASFRRKIRFVENHCSGPRSRCPSH